MNNFISTSFDEAQLKITFDTENCNFEIRNEFDSIVLQDYDIRKLVSVFKKHEDIRKVNLFSKFVSCVNQLVKFSEKDIIIAYHDFALSSIDKYFESHRSYHNDTHILYVLDIFTKYIKPLTYFSDLEKSMIEMALIWHDVEYLPQNSSKYQLNNIPIKSNEEYSADLCYKALIKYDISESIIQRICELIKCTTHYYPNEYDVDKLKSIICDIDLFRLSESFDKFQEGRQLVRREYPNYTDEEWKEGSKQFASHFLKRNRIYTSPVFNSREQAARNNLSKLL